MSHRQFDFFFRNKTVGRTHLCPGSRVRVTSLTLLILSIYLKIREVFYHSVRKKMLERLSEDQVLGLKIDYCSFKKSIIKFSIIIIKPK